MKNRRGGEELGYGTAAEIAGLRTRPPAAGYFSHQIVAIHGSQIASRVATVTTFGLCAKSCFAPNGDRVQVAPCSRASPRRVRFGPTQAPRQNASLAWGRLSLDLAFVVPARHRRGAALSYRVRVWPFSAIRG